MPDEKTPDTKDYVLADDPAFKQLASMVTTIGRSAKSTADGQEALQTTMKELIDKGIKVQEPAPKKTVVGDEELEDMSQAALSSHIIKSVLEAIDPKFANLDDKITNTADNIAHGMTKERLTKFADQHPDFVDVADKMKSILEVSPQLGLDRAYNLVKEELTDEERTVLDEKYPVEGLKKRTEKDPFGGLTPTSTVDSTNADADENKQVSAKEAAEIAWAETVESLPSLADAG